MKKHLLTLAFLVSACLNALAVEVTVTMNATSKTMTLKDKEGKSVEVGEPTLVNKLNTYTFDVEEGTYVLEGFKSTTSGSETVYTSNGTIELNVSESNNTFQVWTYTTKATNYTKVTNADNTTSNVYWEYGTDYTATDVAVRTREGELINSTYSAETNTVLVLNGNSVTVTFSPSEARKAEGYVDAYAAGTVTANATGNVTIAKGSVFTVSFPATADFSLNRKSGSVHYIPFIAIPVESEVTEGDVTTRTYILAHGSMYNYRISMEGKRTRAGIFTYYDSSLDDTKVYTNDFKTLSFTEADFNSDAKMINKDITVHSGVDVANILTNINAQGYLQLNTGDTKDLMCQRDWELTNNVSSNYFIEPDYNYTIIPLEGDPISITQNDAKGSAWATLKAESKGTAIVVASYDAIDLNLYSRSGSGTVAKPYDITKAGFVYDTDMVGWSACWPENAAVYVVSVDEAVSQAEANMQLNATLNATASKVSGDLVDAEHDTFYFLSSEEGAEYTFTPAYTASVAVAYPTLTESTVSYDGKFNEVAAISDSTYTVLLKEGRNIVRLLDADGNATYQVLTARPVTQTITNLTNEGAEPAAGDQVTIQYEGLRHPANKMAGIYNMQALIQYSDTMSNVTLTPAKATQYNFSGTATAQAVTVTIPDTWDADLYPRYNLTAGCIKLTGYGDPVGNHRYVDKVAGRSPNFTAISHNTYLSSLPSISLTLKTDVVNFEDCDIKAGGYRNGSDMEGYFTSKDLMFMNYYNASWSSWCGFGLSATTDSIFRGYSYVDVSYAADEFNSCVGGGLNSPNFAVVYYSEYNAWYSDQYPDITADKAIKPEYVYLTNSANAATSMKNGDSYAKAFTESDWLKVTITGYGFATTEGGEDFETGSVDFYLAKDGNIVSDWQKVDLSTIGACNYLRFTMDSTDKLYGYMNTPAYFCLDNLMAKLTDDTPTAIEAVREHSSSVKNTSNEVYDITGRRVDAANAPGVYFINGKKILIQK